MLKGYSPYIHPDFYNPLPSTDDAKSSPLALLAKTCNSIGKDSPPAKSISKSLDKNDVNQRATTSHEKKSSGKDTNGSKHEQEKQASRDIAIKVEITSAPHKSVSKIQDSKKEYNNLSITKSSESTSSSRNSSSVYKKSSTYLNHHSLLHPPGIRFSSHPLHSDLPLGLCYSGIYLSGINPELVVAYHQAQLMTQSGFCSPFTPQAALKAKTTIASSSSYVSYTRVRTPSGASTLVPVCKDPYCNNCQLTVQTSHSSTTCKTPACSQCAHEKALLGLTASASGYGFHTNPLSLYPHLATHPSSAPGLSSLHSLYPHSAIPAAHQEGLPYVCNWVAGHDYCGKRFNSSEQFMTHLRSHTPRLETELPLGLGLHASSTAMQSASTSPDTLRKTYPKNVSPGVLTNSRYHPYKHTLNSIGSYSPGFPYFGTYYPF